MFDLERILDMRGEYSIEIDLELHVFMMNFERKGIEFFGIEWIDGGN